MSRFSDLAGLMPDLSGLDGDRQPAGRGIARSPSNPPENFAISVKKLYDSRPNPGDKSLDLAVAFPFFGRGIKYASGISALSQVATERTAVDEVRDRIEAELGSVLDRLRQLGGAIVIEEFPGALGNSTPSADLMDEVQVQEDREISLVSRRLLVGRANQLAEALEGLRGGKDGICEECSEPKKRHRRLWSR